MFGGLDIIRVTGRTVLDSGANPAIEAEVELENGARGRALVSAENRIKAEEEEALVNEFLSEALLYEEASDQGNIDHILLKTAAEEIGEKKGGSGVLALSMAAARAAGAGLGLPLYRYLGGTSAPDMPVPMMTMISGGEEAVGIDFSEIMIIPQGAESYSEGLRMGTEIYHTLKRLLSVSGQSTSTGDGGGLVPDLNSTEEALRYLMDAINLSGYKPGKDVLVAIHADAARLYAGEDGVYRFSKESKKGGILVSREQQDMISYYLRLSDGFPIAGILNGLWNGDMEGRSRLLGMLGHRALVMSEDFFASNGIVIKMEQAGTVTGVLKMVERARKAGLKVILSNGFRETEEAFLGDMAVAVHADYVKSGAPCRGECTAKYNELLRIEEFYNKRNK